MEKEKKSLGKKILGVLQAPVKDCKEIGQTFAHGDWKTKVSFLIMGFGPLVRGQILRGIAFLAAEIAFIWYMIAVGAKYLKDIGTLGTVQGGFDENYVYTYGDNSFFILLFGVLSLFVVIAFIFVWRLNVRVNMNEEKRLKEGKALATVKQDLHSLLDENFDKTLLALPVTGVFLFVLLPIVFMICVAFTNYDANHQSPTNLFTWVGLENFKNLFSMGTAGFGKTFVTVLNWTLVWALFATFLTYFLGMAVAILINKKGIKFKKVWRTILVMTIAIPQFVSLLYVSKMFAADGLVNSYLMKWGWIDQAIPFWTKASYARPTILLINLWVGIPYVMLIMTGLLMNIPEELYESAKIDGASPFQTFRKITLPYMLFVTGPYLLTQFTGNLNNFNIIFLLSQGKPQSLSLTGGAGYTDLLVTWLYKMTVDDTNYKMAAVIGIMVFVVVAVVSLAVYNILPSVKDEEGFQ
ncbi:MAG: sugar ABC transporter permease [bacterium]|nr:sugar ABC transporter permease [Clostridium sp.]MCM1538991.1 sugar ABC transporter permease [bacterium]